MTHHYFVLENGSEIVACTSRIVAIDFIREIYDEDFSHARARTYAIYNETTGVIITLRKERIMDNNTLFAKAAKAIDNYAKACEMGAESFANYFFARFQEYEEEIKARGLDAEFKEFMLVA